MSGKSNRTNEGNQHPRLHHDAINTSPDKEAVFVRTDRKLNEPTFAHEYYAEFDHTDKGINPLKPIKRHSH